MKLPFELFLIASSTLSAPLIPRSATFSHLTGLTSNTQDLSTTDARHPSKYFHEFIYHHHYDGRFADGVQSRPARLLHMRLLLRSYTAAMNRAGVRTWLMHGSLLGWWWNRGMFPWDSDLDFCVEERGMAELGGWWNMTVHEFSAEELGLYDASTSESNLYPGRRRHGDNVRMEVEAAKLMREPPDLETGVWDQLLKEGKKYLLEVNPHYTTVSTSDSYNKIDARWIDISTGLFIDITTIHPVPRGASDKSDAEHQIFLEADDESPSSPTKSQTDGYRGERPEEMYTKDTHLYTTSSLFPLRQSTFEGADVRIPYAYEQLLIEEYGPRALVETWFDGYGFDAKTKQWVPAPEPSGGGRGLERLGGGRKGGKKPKWKPVDDEERDPVKDEERNRKDNKEQEVYTPKPGHAGEVHVVPGNG